MSKSFTGQFQENMAKIAVMMAKNPLMQMSQKMKADFGKRALSTAALSAILMNSFAGQAQAAWTDFLPSMETMSAAVKSAAGYASDAASKAWSMAPSKETLGSAASTVLSSMKEHPYVAGGTAVAVGLPIAYMLYQYWNSEESSKTGNSIKNAENSEAFTRINDLIKNHEATKISGASSPFQKAKTYPVGLEIYADSEFENVRQVAVQYLIKNSNLKLLESIAQESSYEDVVATITATLIENKADDAIKRIDRPTNFKSVKTMITQYFADQGDVKN